MKNLDSMSVLLSLKNLMAAWCKKIYKKKKEKKRLNEGKKKTP